MSESKNSTHSNKYAGKDSKPKSDNLFAIQGVADESPLIKSVLVGNEKVENITLGVRNVSIEYDLNPESNRALADYLKFSYYRYDELFMSKYGKDFPISLEVMTKYFITFLVSRVRHVHVRQLGMRNAALKPIIRYDDDDVAVPTQLGAISCGIGVYNSAKYGLRGCPTIVGEINKPSSERDEAVAHPFVIDANSSEFQEANRAFRILHASGNMMNFGYQKDIKAHEEFLFMTVSQCGSINPEAEVAPFYETSYSDTVIQDAMGAIYIVSPVDIHPGFLMVGSVLGIKGIEHVMPVHFIGVSTPRNKRMIETFVHADRKTAKEYFTDRSVYHAK